MADTDKVNLYPDELRGIMVFMDSLPSLMGAVGEHDWVDGSFRVKDFRDGIAITYRYDYEAESWYVELDRA